jgi:hypothetical protein
VQQAGTATAQIDQRATTVAATQTAVANAGFAQRTAIAVTQTAEVLVIQQTQQAQQLGATATVQAQQVQATGTAQVQQTSLAQIATGTAVAEQTALVQQTATAIAGQTATAVVDQTATAAVLQTATAAVLQTATAAIEQTAVSLTATASVPNEITSFNFSPPPPLAIPIGFRITINFTYTTREPGGVQIWVLPYLAGGFAPGGFYGGLGSYPSGSGSGSTFFGTSLPASRIDGVRILMRSATSSTILFDRIVPVTYIIP